MLSIAVIICAYSNQRREQLHEAIRSVQEQEHRPDQVVVVIDNNESLLHDTREFFPHFEVVPNDGMRGLSGARNAGIRRTWTTVIAFLDDDAIAEPAWLGRLTRHYNNPAVVAAGGKVLPLWQGGRPPWFPEEFQWVVGCSYRGLPQSLHPVRNPIGCNMSFRRTVFETIGFFREGFGRTDQDAAGGEETDLCIRTRQRMPEAIILYDPEAVVHHRVPTGRSTWGYFRKRCLAEGRSKNALVESLGAGAGLSAEHMYVTRTLPKGVARALLDAVLRLDPWGLPRAVGILAGLTLTVAGYAIAKLSRRPWDHMSVRTFQPIKVVTIDIANPPSSISLVSEGKGSYGGIFCLVRSGVQPLSIVELEHPGPVVETAEVLSALGSLRPLSSISLDRPCHGVAVVIATRDRANSLNRCLLSLFDQTRLPDEVIVVDNAPASTATADLLARQYSGRVRHVLEPIPGLGRAHNTGLQHVSSDLVLFTDDDVVLDRYWVAAMSAPMEEHAAVGCVTGLILPAELETRAQVWAERHGGFGKGLRPRTYDLGANRPKGALFPFTAGQFGSGANMAFRASALKQVGGFDSALGAGTLACGGDDLAAFFSIISGGFQLVYQPQGIVWHHHRRGEDGMRRQAYCYGVGLGAYLTKILLDDPRRFLRLAAALPAGILHMAGPFSIKRLRLPSDYPKRLVWIERLGIVAGVPGYLRSVSKMRRDDRARSIASSSNAIASKET
ncbi:glycosyltransferase family 2 protein [Sinorhizobium fredii]|uniref:Glycosyltransferase family 2 protein n=1 Tax=Rhizobium fredii TaxID=380 RepID=A0A2L0H433_RHIFR|nr:glycosyltransferase [Sinorhizobium fredii]AUX76251.1 glycosyltransferase family 2 protein [Sinorhizobium fredii]